jgi:hypothetical protein
MKVSEAIGKARGMVARGWTSNAKRVERDAAGNITAVCAQEAIDQVAPPGPLRRAMTELVKHTSVMGGLMPSVGNDDLGQAKVLAAFDEATETATCIEEALAS